MTLVKGLGLFVFFYAGAWLGWFTVLTAARFALLEEYFLAGFERRMSDSTARRIRGEGRITARTSDSLQHGFGDFRF